MKKRDISSSWFPFPSSKSATSRNRKRGRGGGNAAVTQDGNRKQTHRGFRDRGSGIRAENRFLTPDP